MRRHIVVDLSKRGDDVVYDGPSRRTALRRFDRLPFAVYAVETESCDTLLDIRFRRNAIES